jgi:hypothetical protein
MTPCGPYRKAGLTSSLLLRAPHQPSSIKGWRPSRLLILAMHIRQACSADLIHEDFGFPVRVS